MNDGFTCRKARWYEKQTKPERNFCGSKLWCVFGAYCTHNCTKITWNVISFQLGTLIRVQRTPFAFFTRVSFLLTLSLWVSASEQQKKLALENFMFCPESVNYVNVLICNYVYVSKRLLYYYSIVSTRRHVYVLFRSFFCWLLNSLAWASRSNPSVLCCAEVCKAHCMWVY